MPSRFALPDAEYEELKKRVCQRDGWKCRACSSRSSLNVHHIIFRSHGGPDYNWNLVTLCDRCHRSVHGRIPTEFIVILPKAGEGPPNADIGLRFKRYPTVRKRKTWNQFQY